MLTISEVLVLQELAYFADENGLNKSKMARDLNITRFHVHNILKKFKKGEINVKRKLAKN